MLPRGTCVQLDLSKGAIALTTSQSRKRTCDAFLRLFHFQFRARYFAARSLWKVTHAAYVTLTFQRVSRISRFPYRRYGKTCVTVEIAIDFASLSLRERQTHRRLPPLSPPAKAAFLTTSLMNHATGSPRLNARLPRFRTHEITFVRSFVRSFVRLRKLSASMLSYNISIGASVHYSYHH